MLSNQELEHTNSTPIYIEYEYFKIYGVNKYKVHLSFASDEIARSYFGLYTYEWDLPVTREDNRIIFENVSETDDLFGKGYSLILQFEEADHAENFNNSLLSSYKDSKFKLPRMNQVDRLIYLPNLLQPRFSLENRIRATNIYNQCIQDLLILKELNYFPLELCLKISKTFFDLQCEYSDEYLQYIIEINKIFKIPKGIQIEQQYKRVDCRITYNLINGENDNPEYVLHLICLNDKEADNLVENIRTSGIKINYIQDKNKIIIKSYDNLVGITYSNAGISTMIEKNNLSIGLVFQGPICATKFFSFVRFHLPGIRLEDEEIQFPTVAIETVEQVNDMLKVIDDGIIGYLNDLNQNSIRLFPSTEMIDCISILKNNIIDGMYQGLALAQIIADFMLVHGKVINRDNGIVNKDTVIAKLIYELPQRFERKCLSLVM